MGQRVRVSCKLKNVGITKVSSTRLSRVGLMEFVTRDPKLDELAMSRLRFRPKTEPVHVAKCWDDLWLGVKGQSNLEIAGFPRKLFR